METLRIAIITETLPPAQLNLQPWRYLGRLARALQQEGHDAFAVTTEEGLPSWNGVPVVRHPERGDFRTARGLRRLLQDHNADGGVVRMTASLFFSMRQSTLPAPSPWGARPREPLPRPRPRLRDPIGHASRSPLRVAETRDLARGVPLRGRVRVPLGERPTVRRLGGPRGRLVPCRPPSVRSFLPGSDAGSARRAPVARPPAGGPAGGLHRASRTDPRRGRCGPSRSPPASGPSDPGPPPSSGRDGPEPHGDQPPRRGSRSPPDSRARDGG